MLAGARTSALRAYGRLPARARVFLVRRFTPLYSVGSMCMVERPDGAVLLVRHSYRRAWGLPGGLLKRNEAPAAAAARETREEIGLDLDLRSEPQVVVDPDRRRIDFIYQACLEPGQHPAPQSAEIVDARWFAGGQLPRLQEETAAAFERVRSAAALDSVPSPFPGRAPGARGVVVIRGRARRAPGP